MIGPSRALHRWLFLIATAAYSYKKNYLHTCKLPSPCSTVTQSVWSVGLLCLTIDSNFRKVVNWHRPDEVLTARLTSTMCLKWYRYRYRLVRWCNYHNNVAPSARLRYFQFLKHRSKVQSGLQLPRLSPRPICFNSEQKGVLRHWTNI